MKIKLIRTLDFWLGIPLCLVLSILNCILKVINHKKKEENGIEKILFIKLSELGAIALSYPLLRRMRKQYPLATLLFLTFNKNKSIFKLLEGAVNDEDVLTIRNDSLRLFILDIFKVIKRLQKERIDVVFDLDFFSRFTAILTYLSRANKRIGFYRYNFEGLYRGNILTHKIQYNPLIHIAKSYLSLSQVVKKRYKSTPELEKVVYEEELVLPEYTSKREVKEKMQEKLRNLGISSAKRLFLINPGDGTISLREWPVESFIILSRMILEDIDNYIIIIGAKETADKKDILLRAINNQRCVSLVGQTRLEELMELFLIANVLISNDCGIAHIAALTPIKKIVIFGPESPEIFTPLGRNNRILYSNWPCSPCLSILNHRNPVCKDNKCLKVIAPDEVYESIKQFLE